MVDAITLLQCVIRPSARSKRLSGGGCCVHIIEYARDVAKQRAMCITMPLDDALPVPTNHHSIMPGGGISDLAALERTGLRRPTIRTREQGK